MLKKILKKINQYFIAFDAEAKKIERWGKNNKDKINAESDEIIRIGMELTEDKFFNVVFKIILLHISKIKRIELSILSGHTISRGIGQNLKSKINRSSVLYILTIKKIKEIYMCFDICDVRRFKKIGVSIIHPEANDLYGKFINGGVLEYRNISIGDLVIDTYLRYKPSAHFDKNDKFAFEIVNQALSDVDDSISFFSENKITHYLTSYTTYIQHGIPVRVALKLGLNVFAFGERFGKKLTHNDWSHVASGSDYKLREKTLKNNKDKLIIAESLLNNRMLGIKDDALNYLKNNVKIMDSNTKLEAGSVVIFLHDFFDSPHIYNNIIYQDFSVWLSETINILNKKKIKFYLKEHPNQIEDSENYVKYLKNKNPEYEWLDKSTSNRSIAQNAIRYAITVYGTVAHEMAFMGIPTICCADNPHHAYNFVYQARDSKHYEQLIETLDRNMIDPDQLRSEAISFYYMHNINPDEDDLDAEMLSIYRRLQTMCFYDEESKISNILKLAEEMPKTKKFDKFIETL